MGRILKWRTWLVCRAPSSSLKTTYGDPLAVKPHVIVELEDEDGRCGYGEATPLPKFTGETARSIQLILEAELLPLLSNRECTHVSALVDAMDLHIHGNPAAKAAVDMALYDLAAKELEVPEYVLLGGLFRPQVMLNRHIGICSVEEAVSLARGFAEQGCQSIKMKVGNDPEEDIRRVIAVRQAIGSRALRIDANQGYSLASARRVLEALQNQDLQYCEQPLPPRDYEGLRMLKNSVAVPIGVDESLLSLQDAMRIAECHCADVCVIKLIKTGGLFRARQLAAIAEAAGMQCVVTSAFDTQIGAAHCLHLAAALPNAKLACDLTCYATQPQLARTAHQLSDGALAVGQVPGCGVVNIAELAREMR